MLPPLRVLLVPLAVASASTPRPRAAHQGDVQRQPTADSVRSEPATLRVSSGTLHGTLEVPASLPRPPVVLIISGSGPTDRNGNNPLLPGRNDALALLADSLADRGIASLRYDKRGIAVSAGALQSEENLTIDTLVADAVGWLRQLRASGRFGRVGIVGHSEGSLIAILAAEAGGADALVSLEGAGRPAGEVLREQLAAQPATSFPRELLAQSKRAIAELEAGRRVEVSDPRLAALFRPSVQPYLISWLRYDPARELARLSIPILIVQGATDLQTGEVDARRLADASARARLVTVPGMNHVLKAAPAERSAQMPAYTDPAVPLAPGLVDAVAAFLQRSLAP